jgi:Dolichyl-phosphate-mannose-protein mannosyltransferase
MALAALLLLPGLGDAPFDDPGEGQHGEIAREMATSGDWLVPRLNGVRYLDKPPLLYWLDAAAFSALGVSPWTARLAPLVGTLMAAAGTALLGARLLGPGGGFFAAGALLSCALFMSFGRYVRPETLFVAGIQWGFAGLLLGLSESEPRPSRAWPVLGCAALGVASFAKDLLGLVGPLAAVGLALGLRGAARPLRRWLPPAGVILLIVIGGGWYAVALRQPGFAWYTVVDNHLLNAVRLRRFPDEDVPLSALEFLGVSALGAFPWILASAVAIGALVRRRAWRRREETPWTALALWAMGVVAVFVLVPFRLPHYALPAYPALALLAARGWQQRPPRAMITAHALLFAFLAVACAAAAGSDGRALMQTVLSTADVYTRKEIALGQAELLPPWAAFEPLFARAALALGAGSLALVLALRPRWRGLGRWVVLATMLAVMPAVPAAVSALASSRAVRGMADEVARRLGPDDLLVHEGPIENSGALELYSRRRPILLEATRSVLGFGATLPESRETFWDAERFRREWCGGRRILLVTPRSPDVSIVSHLPAGSVTLLSAQNGRRLYENARSACAPRAERGARPTQDAVELAAGQGVGYGDAVNRRRPSSPSAPAS